MKQVVRALLKNSEWKYLLVKHHSYDTWTTPGWHIEEKETLHKALKREMKEEFWVKIRFLSEAPDLWLDHIEPKALPIAIYKIEYDSHKYGKVKKMEYVFHAEVKSMLDFTVDEKEIAEHAWFDAEEVENLENIYPQIPILVRQVTAASHLPS